MPVTASSKKSAAHPPSSKGKPKTEASGQEDASERLFQTLKDGGVISTDIDRLVETACSSRCLEAVAELVNLIVVASGGDGAITQQHIREDKVSDVLTEIFARMAKESDKYPLASSDKVWKKFKASWAPFWKEFAKRKCGAAFNSESFTENLQQWVETCSMTGVRAFRHQALVAIYAMMEGLCDLLGELAEQERKLTGKQSGAAAQGRARQIKRIQEVVSNFASISVVHRAIDICPELRVLSMQYIATWSAGWDVFLTSKYTKLVGWNLWDKDASVRQAALEALERMWKLEGAHEAMSSFAARFTARVREMCLDVASGVQCAAIRVLGELGRNEHAHGCPPDIFKEEHARSVIALVADEKASVRAQVGAFLKLYLKVRVLLTCGDEQADTDRMRKRIDYFVAETLRVKHPRAAALMVDSVHTNAGHKIFDPWVERVVEIACSAKPAEAIGLVYRAGAEGNPNAEVQHICLDILLAILEKSQGHLYLYLKPEKPNMDHDPIAAMNKKDAKAAQAAWERIGAQMQGLLAQKLPEIFPKQFDDGRASTLSRLVRRIHESHWQKRAKGLIRIAEAARDTLISGMTEQTLAAAAQCMGHFINMTSSQGGEAVKLWDSAQEPLLKKVTGKVDGGQHAWLRIRVALQEGLPWRSELHVGQAVRTALAKVSPEDPAAGEVALCAAHTAIDTVREAVASGDWKPCKGLWQKTVPELCRLADHEGNEGNLQNCHSFFVALSHVWTVIRSPTIDAKWHYQPTAENELALVRVFKDYAEAVRPCLKKKDDTVRGAAETLKHEQNMSEALLAMGRMMVLSWVSADYANTVLRLWPTLHQHGQNIVSELWKHLTDQSPDGKAWHYDCSAIQLAHQQYMMSGENHGVRLQEKLQDLYQLAAKFAATHTFAPKREFITRVCETMIDHTAQADSELPTDSEDTNTHMLRALVPYCRFLEPEAARSLIALLAEKDIKGMREPGTIANENISFLVRALAKATGAKNVDECWDSEAHGTLSAAEARGPKTHWSEPGGPRATPAGAGRSTPQGSQRVFDDDSSSGGEIEPDPDQEEGPQQPLLTGRQRRSQALTADSPRTVASSVGSQTPRGRAAEKRKRSPSPQKASPKKRVPSPKKRAPSPKKGSPKKKAASPKKASPKKKAPSPKKASPKKKAASPKKASPKKKAPSPKKASPKKKAASPKKASPKKRAPSPKKASPQKSPIKRAHSPAGPAAKRSRTASVRSSGSKASSKVQSVVQEDEDEDDDDEPPPPPRRMAPRGKAAAASAFDDEDGSDDDLTGSFRPPSSAGGSGRKSAASVASSKARHTGALGQKWDKGEDESADEDEDDEDDDYPAPPPKRSTPRGKASLSTHSSGNRPAQTASQEIFTAQVSDDDEDDDMPPPPRRKAGMGKAASLPTASQSASLRSGGGSQGGTQRSSQGRGSQGSQSLRQSVIAAPLRLSSK
eukprot:TRINITY_DN7093_c0_g1_i1.p1 TRINITY_DN7093_c0_g1~~TRINITY_DN7093_c0_g1_i1.p1  ORF type:complete len:1445 (+),score=438.20 TRINITY_DN7093_c0_g1_i1:114-4448(+)